MNQLNVILAEFLEQFVGIKQRSVASLSEVMECCVVTGSHDYVLRIVARDLGAYERFVKEKLATIKGVADIETTITLNQTMLRSVLPL